MSVMEALLRRHGATMVERDGRRVAAHFPSLVPAEVAVCRSHVGLALRPDRATLDLYGPQPEVDAALELLAPYSGRVRWKRRAGRAVIECAVRDAEACVSAMLAADEVDVSDASALWVAMDLIGPNAAAALEASELEEDGGPILLMSQEPAHVELLAPAAHGPWLWNELVDSGAELGILPVGIEALEHLEVADRLHL